MLKSKIGRHQRYGLLMFLVLGLSFLNQVYFLSTNTLQYSGKFPQELWQDKIDLRLLEKLAKLSSNSAEWEENVDIIIMIFPNYPLSLSFPSDVKIIQEYASIKGIHASSPLSSLPAIAQMPEVKSIWWNLPIDSSNSPFIDPSIFLKAASSNFDPTFANFTSDIGVNDLWQRGFNGSDVIIAILDTGVDITGALGGDLGDFDGNSSTIDPKFLGGVSMVPEEPLYYTDLNGRGTFHAGIACGTGYLNHSYIGVAPGANYLNVKVYDSLGITFWSFIISGMEWAVSHGADILLFCSTIPGLYFDPVCQAVNSVVDQGVLIIAPAGDDGPGYMSINTPAQSHKAFTVGAYNSFTQTIWNQSSRGPSFDFTVGPDVIAPGVGLIGIRSRILSQESLDLVQSFTEIASQFGYQMNFQLNLDLNTLSTSIPKSSYGTPLSTESNYTRASGTGAAAAVVAGAAAILMSAFPMASPEFIQQALMKTAIPITKIDGRDSYDANAEGMGLINVSAAFKWLNNIFFVNEYQILPTSIPLLYPGIVTTADIRNLTATDYINLESVDMDTYDISTLFSTQGMMTALVVTNSSDSANLNSMDIHLPLNQFGIEFSLSTAPQKRHFYWFSQFDVIREMHQMLNSHIYQEGYNRYAGVLGLNGLYIVVLAETWSYSGNYLDATINVSIPNPFYNFTTPTTLHVLNATNHVNAIKYSFQIINDRPGVTFQNMTLISYFKADLFLNETGINLSSADLTDFMNFTYDDRIYFDPIRQTLWVEDENNASIQSYLDKWTSMGFQGISNPAYKYAIGESISLLANITVQGMKAPQWNMTTNQYLQNIPQSKVDPGFAMAWNLSDVPYKSLTNFTGVLSCGVGNSSSVARQRMNSNTALILTNVTNYNVTDLMVLSVELNRLTEKDIPYTSRVKVINIGNQPVAYAELAFIVNRSTSDNTIETYSVIQKIRDIQPYTILEYTASWVPLETGVYIIGWIFGDIQHIPNEANLLSNLLARPVFVFNGNYYDQLKTSHFLVFPASLDQNPMRIFSPLDYGIYNLTVLSVRNIYNVDIGTDGLGRNIVILLKKHYDVLRPYETILVLLFGNPICPPGTIRFNLTFTIQGEAISFYKIPVEIQIQPNRGRIWFDATHLNLFVSENLVGTIGFSALDGFSSAQLNQTNITSFGNVADLNQIELNKNQPFDITRFFDLNERLDTTWGNFYKLRQIWAEPESNHGKGASLFTIIPFLELNISEYIGLDLTQFRTSELIPPTSFLGDTLGDYWFNSNILSTNTINHDLLQFFDGVVINDPEQAFLPQEIQNITSWVEQGGILFVFAEDKWHNNIPSLNQLLSPYGIILENETWYPFSENGYYVYNITQLDRSDDLISTSPIDKLQFKNPIKISKSNSSSPELKLICNDTIAHTKYGAGQVIVVGDNDLFKNLLLDNVDNTEFARQILRSGMENYFQTEITVTPDVIPLYHQGFVDVNLTNYALIEQKNLTSQGFLFISAFFFENGTLFNASLYGMSIPGLPMFHTDKSHYATFLDSNWFLVPGDFYVLILIDHPAAVSELIYIKLTVINGPPPAEIFRYQTPTAPYPHFIDIIAVVAIVIMGLNLWYYNMEKYKTRLRITPLKGEYLNIAKTRLNEGKSLLKLLSQGLEKGNVEEIERIRFLLSNSKRILRYFKELKEFGDSIGEHY